MSEISPIIQQVEPLQAGQLCSSSNLNQILLEQLKAHTQEIMDRSNFE